MVTAETTSSVATFETTTHITRVLMPNSSRHSSVSRSSSPPTLIRL